MAFSDIAKYLDKLDTEQRTEMYDCVNIVAEITEHLSRPVSTEQIKMPC